MSKLIDKLQDIYCGKGYVNKHKFLLEATMINSGFKKIAAKVYKNGIAEIENETEAINSISKITHPSDLRNIVPPKYGDVSWIETTWMISKSKLRESFPIFVLTGIILTIIYYLISKTPEKDPVSETVKRISKNANKLNSKNKKAISEAINSFKNFYKGK